MIRVEGGRFSMGEKDITWAEPVHLVNVPDFYIGQFPVTQALWETVMGNNPSHFKGPAHPVENISWEDTRQFLEKLNAITGHSYRLPSEAEWEYAARGGKRSRGFLYAGGHKLKEVGWYWDNSHQETKPVGLKQPNELGLYDMSGNVWEWCADHWQDSYAGAPDDGSTRTEGGEETLRVIRGGSWTDYGGYCRVSSRFRFDTLIRNDVLGFRVARY